jgi:hypothetical protein
MGIYKTKKVIDYQDLNKLVEETYGKPYNFQQQDGCKSRGVEHFTIPDEVYNDDEPSLEEWINTPFEGSKLDWVRSFYPNAQDILNDLHTKGLIEAGDYTIEIDW